MKLVVWGASGHAAVVADAVRSEGKYEIVGFLDDAAPDRAGTVFCGAPVLGGREQLERIPESGVEHLVLGFGDCAARLKLSALVRSKGFSLATVVHPRAVVAHDATVGPGTVVAAGAVINPGAEIGESAIVNTCASVDHHCVVGDAAHIAPGARLAGGVEIGVAGWVGIGAIVADKLRIGPGSVIGAGAVVVSDVPGGVVAYGIPARIVRRTGPLTR